MGKYDKYRQPQTTQQSKYSDIINKYKKKEADKDMGIFGTAKQQLGEVTSQVYQGIKNIPKEEGLIRKTWGDFEKRAENINQNNATMPMGDRKTLRNAGQLLGAANDFIGNTFVSGIKTFVPKSLRDSAKDVGNLALETKPGQMTKEVAKSAYTQWKAFEKSNPELAKDLGAVGNIANFALNFVGGSQASKLKPTGLSDDILSNINRGVRNTAEKVTPTVQRMASKIPGQVDNLSTGAAEVGVSAATGLSREAQQIIKKQPGLYQQARQGTITREAVTDDVVGALSKRMDDISDLGKGYETIRTSTITVPKSDIANIAVSHLDDLKVSKIDLPIGDRGTVQKALDYIRELPDTMTAQNALSLRRKFDDLINWKSEATGEGKRIIKGLRKKVDDYLGEKLPGLKDLDRKYGPEREFIDKVKGTILDKQGNLKDGAISSVANMIGKGKEMKLDRFEKLLPGIGDKVRALKAFEEIQNLAQIKTGSVARQIFSFAVGGIPGFVATNPYVVGYALEKYGLAKQAIKTILSKGKKISEAEAKAVHKAVKSVSKKEVEKIIAGKVGTPLLPAGKSSVATGNTGGNIPPADLTPNASTGNAVSSQARISPPQTAGLLDSPKSTISETAQQVSTPVVKSPGEKVNTPIIPKSQPKATAEPNRAMIFEGGKKTGYVDVPKAKLRTNEDALKKAVKTPEVDVKFTREQATKYMDDNINRIMKEVKAKKITGDEGKAQMLELQNDMKYLRLGITPEKLKAGKEKLLDGVMDELTKSPKPESKLPKTPQEGKTDMLEVGKKFEMNSNMMDRKGKSVEFNDKIEITKVGDEFVEYKTDTGAVGSINKESFFNKVMDGKIKPQSPTVKDVRGINVPQSKSVEYNPFKTAIDDIEARIAKIDGKKTYTDQLGESFVGGQVGFKSGKASEIKKIDRAFEQNSTKAREINALSKELDEVKSLQRGYEKNKKLLSAFETQLEKGKTSGDGFTTKEFMSEIERIKKDIARFERSKYFDKPKSSLPPPQEGKTVGINSKKDKFTFQEYIEERVRKFGEGERNFFKKEEEGLYSSTRHLNMNTSLGLENAGFVFVTKNNGRYIYKNIDFPSTKKTSLSLSQKSNVVYSKPDLVGEARKYKSAEEFVKNMEDDGKLLYHGTTAKFDTFSDEFIGKGSGNKGFFGEGHYFTDDKELANWYGKGKNVISAHLTMEKPLQWDRINTKSKYENLLNELGLNKKDWLWDKENGLNRIEFNEKVQEALKKNGYDGIILKRPLPEGISDYTNLYGTPYYGNEYLIFDTKNIKTESQLKNIWEQANKANKK